MHNDPSRDTVKKLGMSTEVFAKTVAYSMPRIKAGNTRHKVFVDEFLIKEGYEPGIYLGEDEAHPNGFFAYAFVSKTEPKHIMVAFRGTKPGDLTITHDLDPNGAGFSLFQRNKKSLNDALGILCQKHQCSHLKVTGHSLGGALAQLCCVNLIQSKANSTLKFDLKKIDISTFQSAGIDSTISEVTNEALTKLQTDPDLNKRLTVTAAIHQKRGDFVHKTGVQLFYNTPPDMATVGLIRNFRHSRKKYENSSKLRTRIAGKMRDPNFLFSAGTAHTENFYKKEVLTKTKDDRSVIEILDTPPELHEHILVNTDPNEAPQIKNSILNKKNYTKSKLFQALSTRVHHILEAQDTTSYEDILYSRSGHSLLHHKDKTILQVVGLYQQNFSDLAKILSIPEEDDRLENGIYRYMMRKTREAGFQISSILPVASQKSPGMKYTYSTPTGKEPFVVQTIGQGSTKILAIELPGSCLASEAHEFVSKICLPVIEKSVTRKSLPPTLWADTKNGSLENLIKLYSIRIELAKRGSSKIKMSHLIKSNIFSKETVAEFETLAGCSIKELDKTITQELNSNWKNLTSSTKNSVLTDIYQKINTKSFTPQQKR